MVTRILPPSKMNASSTRWWLGSGLVVTNYGSSSARPHADRKALRNDKVREGFAQNRFDLRSTRTTWVRDLETTGRGVSKQLCVCPTSRGDRSQSAYGARPPLGFYLVTIIVLVIPEI